MLLPILLPIVLALLPGAPPGASTMDEAAGMGLLVTALVLGIRHGIDWDHIAAITDITSTTAAAEAAEEHHAHDHARRRHVHGHGGASELAAHRPLSQDAHAAEGSHALARERPVGGQ